LSWVPIVGKTRTRLAFSACVWRAYKY